MYMNLFDSHVHSDNSHDGEHSITFLCENAVQKNLMGLCITDHYELELNTEQADLCLRNSSRPAKPGRPSTTGCW